MSAASAGTTLHLASRPRTPSSVASSGLRDELLNETLFRSLPHARVVLEAWRQDYNAERPHSRLGWLTPHAYATSLQTSSSQRDRPLPLSGGSASCPVAS